MSRQNLNILRAKRAFNMKSIFHHFQRAFIEANKITFLEGDSPTLNSIEVLTSKTLTDLDISHDEFALINNMLKEYEDVKKEIKNLKT